MNPIRRFLDFLARMGLSIRDDPPRVVELSGREWGPVVDGLALSASRMPHDDPDAVAALSIVLKNFGSVPVTFTASSWLAFYRLDITAADGTPVALTPYGRELLKPERNTRLQTVRLEPGRVEETQFPVGAIYAVKAKNQYKIAVFCSIPDFGISLSANQAII